MYLARPCSMTKASPTTSRGSPCWKAFHSVLLSVFLSFMTSVNRSPLFSPTCFLLSVSLCAHSSVAFSRMNDFSVIYHRTALWLRVFAGAFFRLKVCFHPRHMRFHLAVISLSTGFRSFAHKVWGNDGQADQGWSHMPRSPLHFAWCKMLHCPILVYFAEVKKNTFWGTFS